MEMVAVLVDWKWWLAISSSSGICVTLTLLGASSTSIEVRSDFKTFLNGQLIHLVKYGW